MYGFIRKMAVAAVPLVLLAPLPRVVGQICSCSSSATIFSPSSNTEFDYNAYVPVTGWASPLDCNGNPISSIEIDVLQMSDNSLIQKATASLDSNGQFSVTIPPPHTGPLTVAWPADDPMTIVPYCGGNYYSGPTNIVFVSET